MLTLTLLLKLGDPVVSELLELDAVTLEMGEIVTLELDVVLGVTAGVTLDVMLWDTEVVTSELDVTLCDISFVGEPLELDEVVAVTLALWDRSVDAEILELDEVVAVTLALWDRSVDAELLELDEVVAVTLALWDRSVVGDVDGDTGDSVLDCVTDRDAAREGDVVTEGAREALLLALGVRESVASADGLREVLRLPLTDRVTVRSIDSLAETLLVMDLDPVSEAVKLGDTGDFVKDGVGVGEGMITVYDMKNTDPAPRLIMLAPIWDPPAL
jgi:hypothetical protein